MKEELIKILPDLKQAIEQGKVYASDLFTRAVAYYKIVAWIEIIIGLLFLIISIVLIIKFVSWYKIKKTKNEYFDLSDVNPFIFFGFIVGFIHAIVLLSCGITNLIQLSIVPEIYMLELIK